MSKLVHLHAKDTSISQASTERGKITGTPVGYSCGEGVIAWPRVVAILQEGGYDGVLSVECETRKQAASSLAYLMNVLNNESLVATAS